ncbi:MAG TPA: DUF2262 domain-containing protein [Haloferula sp.]
MSTEYLKEQERQDAELRARKDRLYHKLNQSPIAEVTGIVDASGAYGSKSRGDELWTVLFTFVSWRDHEGTLHRSELTVRREVEEEKLRALQDCFPPYRIVRLQARIGEDEAFTMPQAVLLEVLEAKAADPELEAIAAGLQEPVALRSKKLGKLHLDRSVGWYEAEVRLGWKRVKVRLHPDSVEKPAAVIAAGERLWSSVRELDGQARERAVAELLDTKNGSWLENGQIALTAAQFKKSMKLQSIVIEEDESFEFWYGDGGLFWGHLINVSGSFGKGFTDASIQG